MEGTAGEPAMTRIASEGNDEKASPSGNVSSTAKTARDADVPLCVDDAEKNAIIMVTQTPMPPPTGLFKASVIRANAPLREGPVASWMNTGIQF